MSTPDPRPEPPEVERTLLDPRTCAWCQQRPATTTVIVAPATPATDTEPATAAHTARTCLQCKVRVERRAAEDERARRAGEHGSRLPEIPTQMTMEQELYSDANLAGQVAHLRIAGGKVTEPEPEERHPVTGEHRCRSCKAPVTFACSTSTGRWMILNATPTREGNLHVANNGKGRRVARVVSGPDREALLERLGGLYLDHHATCPNAEAHRTSARGAA